MEKDSLKILKTEIHNFKNLSYKQVDIDQKSLIVIGSNNRSKSSFIQALTCAFIPSNTPIKPITEGKEKGEVVTVIGGYLNGEPVQYSIEMYFSQSNQKGRLVIYDQEGVKLGSPNQALEAIIGDVSFDIDKFLALAKTDAGGKSSVGVKKQIEMLKKFLPKNIQQDLVQCDVDRKEVYDKRKELNSEVKILEGQMTHTFTDEELEQYSDENRKDEDVVRQKLSKVGETIERWNKVNTGVPSVEKEIKDSEYYISKFDYYFKNADAIQNCIDSIRFDDDDSVMEDFVDKLESVKKSLAGDLERIEGHKEKLPLMKEKLTKGNAWLKKNPEKPTTEVLLAELNVIQDHNVKCDEVTKVKEAFGIITEKKDKSVKMTDQIKGLEKKKKQIFIKNPLPVKGLTFSEEQVLYQAPGEETPQPFNEQQFPSSTIIGVGVKIAMAMNPNLKIIIIKDGSLLDKKMYQGLLRMVEKQGFQLFIEMVSWEQKELEVRFAESEID